MSVPDKEAEKGSVAVAVAVGELVHVKVEVNVLVWDAVGEYEGEGVGWVAVTEALREPVGPLLLGVPPRVGESVTEAVGVGLWVWVLMGVGPVLVKVQVSVATCVGVRL